MAFFDRFSTEYTDFDKKRADRISVSKILRPNPFDIRKIKQLSKSKLFDSENILAFFLSKCNAFPKLKEKSVQNTQKASEKFYKSHPYQKVYFLRLVIEKK